MGEEEEAHRTTTPPPVATMQFLYVLSSCRTAFSMSRKPSSPFSRKMSATVAPPTACSITASLSKKQYLSTLPSIRPVVVLPLPIMPSRKILVPCREARLFKTVFCIPAVCFLRGGSRWCNRAQGFPRTECKAWEWWREGARLEALVNRLGHLLDFDGELAQLVLELVGRLCRGVRLRSGCAHAQVPG